MGTTAHSLPLLFLLLYPSSHLRSSQQLGVSFPFMLAAVADVVVGDDGCSCSIVICVDSCCCFRPRHCPRRRSHRQLQLQLSVSSVFVLAATATAVAVVRVRVGSRSCSHHR